MIKATLDTAPNEDEAAPVHGLIVAEADPADDPFVVVVEAATFVDETHVAVLSVPLFHEPHARDDVAPLAVETASALALDVDATVEVLTV